MLQHKSKRTSSYIKNKDGSKGKTGYYKSSHTLKTQTFKRTIIKDQIKVKPIFCVKHSKVKKIQTILNKISSPIPHGTIYESLEIFIHIRRQSPIL